MGKVGFILTKWYVNAVAVKDEIKRASAFYIN